ncbi:N-acetyltransferase [Pseudoalteromonas piscicida]|uniref:N-acetyltransferase n=2 Tax=Pseudoalteromonas TaxID=53246 RepID=A0AAQ2IS41_PSEO7|nr:MULTISPECIES: GNAT family N-acetyltransferase [Pseudoalteromonas]KJY88237.1 acetyltransferase [Pseudoalteromonas piscicida]TMN33672.1 N-acetyltransferase [Pseudoalteromonas piscicida]TMN39749.1 N-acetyltransferase [Pseudoalteromonas piscicida]TMN53455.1 N-acetyltransferase [Pseudoalteromonas piscicida]TMN56381.1 N-acetyltransferase [Pseudoalteromonas piscicida]
MIQKLNNRDVSMAREIFNVFQRSYKVEAEFIGASYFPPLSRTIEDICGATSHFYGYFENQNLAAVIEIVIFEKTLEIDSLTVDPSYFRKGIAGELLSFAMSEFDVKKVIVETATANAPAIKLYNKHGFVEYKRWLPAHGIEKLALAVDFCS